VARWRPGIAGRTRVAWRRPSSIRIPTTTENVNYKQSEYFTTPLKPKTVYFSIGGKKNYEIKALFEFGGNFNAPSEQPIN
jgi:hypothetical protein